MSIFQQTIAILIESNFASTNVEGSGGMIQFAVATDGLMGQQAANIPSDGLNSVWAIVNHLIYLQDNLRMALLNEAIEHPSMVAMWSPIGEVTDENWELSRQKALDSNRQLAEVVAKLGDEELDVALPMWFNIVTRHAILTIYSHLSYHSAEIVTLRHMQGLRVDHPLA